MKTAVRVISLADQERRRLDFRQGNIGAPACAWEFFDAHRNLQAPLTYDPSHSRVRWGRNLTPAELGCYSSHYANWAWLLESDFEQMIIIEDDIVADWPFIKMLSEQNFSSAGIHYLKLFTKIPPATWRPVCSPFLNLYYHLIQVTSLALGTQGYVLTKQGAQQLVDLGPCVDAPVDVVLDRYWQHGLPILCIHPSPLFERYQTSSIGDARFTRAPLVANEFLPRLGWRLKGRLHRELEARRPLRPSLAQIKERYEKHAASLTGL
jgi:glycosyl transferase family 25